MSAVRRPAANSADSMDPSRAAEMEEAFRSMTLSQLDAAAGKDPLSRAIVFRHVTELLANPTKPRWLCRRLVDTVEAGVVALIIGTKGSLKSFLALHWSMLAAMEGKRVAIVSSEGAGIDRRIKVWLDTFAPQRSPASFDVHVFEGRLHLDSEDGSLELLEALKEAGIKPGQLDVFVLDTISKNTGCMEENSNTEVKAFVGRLAAIRDAFGCTVLAVGHTGHADQSRARGAYALGADTEAEYIVTRPDRDQLAIAVSRERFKDGPELPPLGYTADVIFLDYTDDEGRPVTSLVLRGCEPPRATAAQRITKPRGQHQRALLSHLKDRQRGLPTFLIWTRDDLREACAELEFKRNRSAELVDWITTSDQLVAVPGGYRLADDHLRSLEVPNDPAY